MSKKFSFNLKKLKKEYLFIAILIIVAVIIFFNSFKSINKKATQETVISKQEEYVKNLENKLYGAISSIKGVSKVVVKINVSNSYKSVYLTQKQEQNVNGSTVVKEELVLVGGKPILVQEEFPEICGVVIVANGVDNIMTKANVLSTCVTLLEIDSSKIIILSGKK